MAGAEGSPRGASTPPFRYTAARAGAIEAKWQQRWRDDKVFHAPNPVGDLAEGFERFAGKPKLYVLDMFPYPSGVGLHVGHPLGYIATDIFARYMRMAGRNVLHTIGYDAFGLPAEQFAVQTGQHPRVTTERNIATMRKQLRRLGLAHDERRSVATTDVAFYRWTQWIFLQIFNAW
ncbi:MAG: leucine--tRNA ligase, partial [Planctomycetota bacterium]